jgi:hypothetical protein
VRRATAVLFFSALALGACSSDDADPSPSSYAPGGGSGGSGASGGDEGSGIGGGSGHAGADEQGGEAGLSEPAGGRAGSPAEAGGSSVSGAGGEGVGGTDPPPVDELCARAPELGAPEKLAISTAADERFGGITPDERVIAWTVTEAEVVTLFVARRADAESAFEAPISLVIAAAIDDQIALAPDGRSVAFANPDRRGFSVISRPTLDDAFGLSTPGEFSLLDSNGGNLPAGHVYADPVLAGDGVTFLYSQVGAAEEETLRISSRLSGADPWPVGAPLAAEGFSASGEDRFAPTGASMDGRTLFLWDMAGASEIMAFVDPDSGTLERVADLGAIRGAAPNADCTRLYYGAGDLYAVAIR